jgi:hypothetical protein
MGAPVLINGTRYKFCVPSMIDSLEVEVLYPA